MYHWHSLGEIVGLFLQGLWMLILEVAPLVSPPALPGKYPGWWVRPELSGVARDRPGSDRPGGRPP